MSKKEILSLQCFFETLLQIIEQKKIKYPKYVFCIMIIILYGHYGGYIFSSYELKPLYDARSLVIAHFNEYSPVTFLLYIASIDTLTLCAFVIINFFLWFCFFYIILLTIIRIKFKRFLVKIECLTKVINMFYQFYFSSFLWILYIPSTEINAGCLVVGANSFLTPYREQTDYSQKPLLFLIIGSLSITLVFLLGTILSICYISYDFNDSNLLKRKFKINQILQLLCRSLICTLYYVNISNILFVKHCFGHILGITALYDYFVNIPFRDKFICNFYGVATAFFELCTLTMSLYLITNNLQEYNIFYCIIVPLSFIGGFMSVLYSNKNYIITEIIPSKILKNNKNIYLLDLYLDKFYELGIYSETKKEDKLKILGLVQYLIKNIPEKNNFFHKNSELKIIINQNYQIDNSKLIEIINEIFQLFLKDEIIKSYNYEYQQILLKYCSFLANFQNNPILAYFELKKILFKNKKKREKIEINFSLIFRIVSDIIAKNIENLIIQECYLKFDKLIDSNKILNETRKSKEKKNKISHNLNVVSFARIDQLKYDFLEKIRMILKLKNTFLENLLNGYHNIIDFHNDVIKLMTKIEETNKYLDIEFKEISKTEWKESVICLKLKSIYNLVVLNNIQNFIEVKSKFKEQKKLDGFKLDEIITKTSILEGKSVVILISLLENSFSQIINPINQTFTDFFGFSPIENPDITHLMPSVIAQNHHFFVKAFITKGPQNVFLDENRAVYIFHKDNYIFPVNLYLNFTMSFSDDFRISGIFTKLKDFGTTIMFNEMGEIIGISKGIEKEMIEYDPNELSLFYNNKTKIYYFIPELLDNLPSSEDIQTNLNSNKMNIEIINNKNFMFFFPKSFKIILFYLLKYQKKNHTKFNSFSEYNNSFDKSTKNYFNRFIKSGTIRQYVTKKICNCNLELHLYKSDSKILKIFILKIKSTMTTDEALKEDISISVSRTNTSYQSSNMSGTCKSLKSSASKVDSEENNLISNWVALKNRELKEDNELLEEKNKSSTINDGVEEEEEDAVDEIEVKNKNDKIIKTKKDEESRKSANSTNIGSKNNIFKELIDKKENPEFLKKIILFLIIQISILGLLNIITYDLTNKNIKIIESNFDIGKTALSILNSHVTFVFLDYLEYLNILKNDSNAIPLSIILKNNAYLNLQIDLQNNSNFFNNFELNEYIYIDPLSQNKFNQNISLLGFYKLIQQSFKVLLNEYSLQYFLFLRVNFYQSYIINLEIINSSTLEKYQAIQNLEILFLSLVIISVFLGLIFLILLNAMYNKYLIFVQKILIIVSRMKKYECEAELKKNQNFTYIFNENSDRFLKINFLKNIQKKEKNSKKDESSNVSSQILNSNLSKFWNNIFGISILVIITIFYIIMYLFALDQSSNIKHSLNLFETGHKYNINLLPIFPIRSIIISKKLFKEKNLLNENDFSDLKLLLFSNIQSLKLINEDPFELTIENDLDLKKLITEDICINNNFCQNIQINNFKFGLKGFTSIILNNLESVIKNIDNDYEYNDNEIYSNIFYQNNTYDVISDYQILYSLLNEFITKSESIFLDNCKVLKNNINFFIEVGSFLLGVLLFILSYCYYLKIKNLTYLAKKFLIMIPIEKQNEEITLHLLKNLRTF